MKALEQEPVRSPLTKELAGTLDFLKTTIQRLKAAKDGDSQDNHLVDQVVIFLDRARGQTFEQVPELIFWRRPVPEIPPIPESAVIFEAPAPKLFPPEGHITTPEVLSILGISLSSWDRIKRKHPLTSQEVGGRNFYLVDEVWLLKTQREEEKLARKSRPKKTPEEQPIELGDFGKSEKGLSILGLHLEEMKIYSQLDPEEQRRLNARIFVGQLTLKALSKIADSELLTPRQQGLIKELLKVKKAKFLLKHFPQPKVKVASFLEIAQKSAHWLNKQLEQASHATPELQESYRQKIIERQISLATRGLEAFDKMVLTNWHLAISRVKRYQDLGLPETDLLSFTYEGLMLAAAKHDFRLGFRFSTYATHWIDQRISRGIDECGLTVRLPAHVHERIRKLRRREGGLMQVLESSDPNPLAQAAAQLGENLPEMMRIIKLRHPVSLNKPIGDEGDMELGDMIPDEEQMEKTIDQTLLREELRKLLEILSPRERKILQLRFGLGGGREKTLEEVGQELSVTRERIRQIEKKALKKLSRSRGVQLLIGDENRGPKISTRHHRIHVVTKGRRNKKRGEPLTDPQKEETLTPVQKQELLVNLTCIISSNLAAENLQRISRDLLGILENCTSPEATARLKTISGSRERLEEFLMEGLAATLKRLWEPLETSSVSVKERQIMAHCARIKQDGTSLEAVIRDVCHHFSLSIPVAL